MSLVALSTLVGFAFLPCLLWPANSSPSPSPSSPYPSYLPSPIPEIVLSSSLFCLAYVLRVPLYTLSAIVLRPERAFFLCTFASAIVLASMRLFALVVVRARSGMMMEYDMRSTPTPTLGPTTWLGPTTTTWQDPVFRTVWWLSLNVAEVVGALVQDYQHLGLYREVMVPPGREREFLERVKQGTDVVESNGRVRDERVGHVELVDVDVDVDVEVEDPLATQHRQRYQHRRHQGHRAVEALSTQIDDDFDRLVAVKAREELEDVYGVPFIVCLVSLSLSVLWPTSDSWLFPCHAMPCLALPCLGMPCHAMPRLDVHR